MRIFIYFTFIIGCAAFVLLDADIIGTLVLFIADDDFVTVLIFQGILVSALLVN